MLSVLIICTAIIVLVTLLPLSRHPHWVIRGMDFPRLQIAIVSVVLLVVDAVFLDIQSISTLAVMGATLLCLVWQLWRILLYTVLSPKEVKSASDIHPKRQLSILTSNVLTPNRNADALIQLARKYKPVVLVTL
jgi:endonuclease/exonuclease/phosphatase (EEP) superfamily protein YafD